MTRLARTAGAIALTLTAACAARAAAQETAPAPITARNAVYVELGGNGLLYSVNYDRRLGAAAAGRIGAGLLTAEDDDGDQATVLIVPAVASYLFGGSNSHFEVGLGLAVASLSVDAGAENGFDDGDWFFDIDEDNEGITLLVGTGVLGYRYQRPGGGFVFRAGFTPFFDTDEFIPWGGISFGYAF